MGNQKETKKKRGASIVPIIEAFEFCWSAIRKHHPDLPEAVLIVESNSSGQVGKVPKSNGKKLGHFYNSSWKDKDGTIYHEVVVTGEHLARPATAVFGTILHEAAHAINYVRKIKDTSRGGRYHNKMFKAMAIDLGMVVQQLKIGKNSFGWANTRMTPDTVQKYREAIQNLKTAIESELENLPPAVREWYARKYDDGLIDIGNLTDEEIQKILDDEAEEQQQAETDKKEKKRRDGPWDLQCKCSPSRILKSVKKVAYLEGPIVCGVCNERFEKPLEPEDFELMLADTQTAQD